MRRLPCKSFIHKDFPPWPTGSPKERRLMQLPQNSSEIKQWPYSCNYFCLPSFAFKSLRKYMSLFKKKKKKFPSTRLRPAAFPISASWTILNLTCTWENKENLKTAPPSCIITPTLWYLYPKRKKSRLLSLPLFLYPISSLFIPSAHRHGVPALPGRTPGHWSVCELFCKTLVESRSSQSWPFGSTWATWASKKKLPSSSCPSAQMESAGHTRATVAGCVASSGVP